MSAAFTELLTPASSSNSADAAAMAVPAAQPCGECVGSGGWYRYEPAMDPAPGILYLSCVECRGSGRTAAQGG